MPIIKSAKKRVRTARKAAARNVKTKRTMRGSIKEFRASLTTREDSATALAEAQKSIDTAVKKGLLHKSRAARKKSQLHSEAKAAGVKLGTSKKTTKKPATTKKATTAKKSTATKKSPAKKSTAKKPATKKKTTTKK